LSRPISSKTAAIQSRGLVQSRATGRSRVIANTITGTISNTPRSTVDQSKTIQARAGSLYNANTARVGTTGTVMATSRGVSARAATTSSTNSLYSSGTSSTASSSTSEELLAQTDFCKAQYASCMDNFCNVLDDNQGRCSCSSNVKKYQNAEDALKQATEDLQDVATKIRYLGLTKEEVQTLFSQTAAEEAMQSTTDSSSLKSSLDNIQKLLIDPKSQITTSGSVTSGIDLSSLDFNNGFDFNSFLDDGSSSISNQRGAALFDTARSRCNDILTTCKKQGVDTSMVVSYYDLEIDKQCVAYERSLTDSNDQMKTTIKNATIMLQQARLTVAQNKNKYDLKGCVNALDACMVDDFVCGSGYENCLDASGRYIVNGAVVAGSEPSVVNLRNANWKYGTACVFNSATVTACSPTTDSTITQMINTDPVTTDTNLLTMLKSRIGTVDSSGRAVGMCANVLNQCQNYTFENGTFNGSAKTNQVLKEYLTRTLSNIKAKQDGVMADYMASCQQDIISCFTKNGATTTRPADTAGESLRLSIVAGSCNSYAKTCGSATGILSIGFPDNVSQFICSGTRKLRNSGTAWECGS
jgi:hypothetical protein